MKATFRRIVRRGIIAAGAMTLLAAMYWRPVAERAARADTVGPHQAPIDDKLAAAKAWFKTATIACDAGVIRWWTVYEASLAWKEAVVEAATTKAGRINALEAHRDRMVELARRAAGFRMGSGGGYSGEEEMARFWVLEAKIWLAEEVAKK